MLLIFCPSGVIGSRVRLKIEFFYRVLVQVQSRAQKVDFNLKICIILKNSKYFQN